MRAALLAASLSLFSFCEVKPSPPPAPPNDPIPTPADAGPRIDEPSCGTACAALQALGCPEGLPTDGGATCVDVCEAMRSVPAIGYPLECVSKAATCKAVSDCWGTPKLSPKVGEESLP
jgi:hypothetical protein